MTHSTTTTTGVDTGAIRTMRLGGASLQQIADRIGRSKERVRQGQKYRNKSPEAKARRVASIQRCVARRRHAETTAAS